MTSADDMSVAGKQSRRLTRNLKVINPLGMHARPAAVFVKTVSAFDADIVVERDGNAVSGKSIMGLMTLQAECGSVLRITAEGPQAEMALERLEQLFKDQFRGEATE